MQKYKKLLPQVLIVIILISMWQVAYMLQIFPSIIFPSIFDILFALVNGLMNKQMGLSICYSLYSILRGMLIGAGLAFIFSSLAMGSKFIHKIYYMLISLFDPLPGIALIPLAILWFGAGEGTTIFILIHAVMWPLSRSILDGFSTVPITYVEVGRNIGLKGVRLVTDVYLPAALPNLISGLKTGWARAWRALISAEMIFGVAGTVGGIGWYIYISRYKLDTPDVYASLIAIIIIGLVMEYGVFGFIENHTVKKWGTVR